MKKTFTLCVLAAVLGAAVSTMFTGPADSGTRAAAQDQAELRVVTPQKFGRSGTSAAATE